MKEITIDLVYAEIKEVISDKNRNLVIKFLNGDRITIKRSAKSKRIHRHLAKQFSGDHLDSN
jgi:hypothetical protein